ncbi:MAG: HD domain-containing protein [Clostridia bacterium]|nr:HD domain-containing protein [Clostridia bacterium]
MKHTYHYTEYIEQIKAYNALDEIAFGPEDGKEYVIAKLEERTAKKREIAEIANTIIREYVEVYEKEPEALTEEAAKELAGFAFTLFPAGTRIVSVDATDYGIYYRIAKILHGYYSRGDTENRVMAVNLCSLGHMMLINGHSFSWHESPFRGESIAFAANLDDEGLDRVARSRIMSNLARAAARAEGEFDIDELQSIRDALCSHAGDPPSDYENGVLDFFFDMVLQLFREHCIYAKDHGLKVDTEKARPLLHEAINRIGRDKFSLTYAADSGHLHVAAYFLGDITLDTLLERLINIQQQNENNENPFIRAQCLTISNCGYLTVFSRFSDLPKEEISKRCRERIDDVLPKLVKVTRMVNNVSFNRFIVQFLNAASLTGGFDDLADVILEATVYADKSLFIHTVMVRDISRAIFDHLIEKDPDVFEGVAGRSAEYVRTHKDEMKNLLSECCMYHDIGKFFMLDVVENSMRRLTDDEFGLIKDHPKNFEYIVQVPEDADERVKCIRDCALTHHLWHDGTKGYPAGAKHTKNRPFADILAVADSIDAATDYIGRPYHGEKTLDQLIEEIQREAGTRYGEAAAKALSAPEVREKLLYLTTVARKEVNYRIYAFNKL